MTSTISARQTDEQHIISATEVFDDGRVLVFLYVRVGTDYTAMMTVYPDATLQRGRRVMYVSTMGDDEKTD